MVIRSVNSQANEHQKKPIGYFPFGQEIASLAQVNRTPKRVFILGVYASAVHARWVDSKGKQRIAALAVASEPEIFWRGNSDQALRIISAISLPDGAGHLEPANAQFNGPSGQALDELFLAPLSLGREDAWLCDLIPHSCKNKSQKLALAREYDKKIEELRLPAYDWPELPPSLATPQRRDEIESELLESKADIVITLGDQPLKWFASHFGAHSSLSEYGRDPEHYGRLHELKVADRAIWLLPLVHPRQADGLGRHTKDWLSIHRRWAENPPDQALIARLTSRSDKPL